MAAFCAMSASRSSFFLLAALLILGCSRTASPTFPSWPSGDVAIDLADNLQLDAAIDIMWAVPIATRDHTRAPIALEISGRIRSAMKEQAPDLVANGLFQLASLWRDDPQVARNGLAPYADILRDARVMLAKTGDMSATVLALLMLKVVDGQTEMPPELREILEYAEQIAIAENGELGKLSRSLTVLEPVVREFPDLQLTNQWVALMLERQQTVHRALTTQRASFEMVRAHNGVVSTARRIATTLARSGQRDQIATQVRRVKGIGAEAELSRVVALYQADPQTNMETLANTLLRGGKDDRDADALAAVAVCYPGPELARCAEFSDAAGRLAQPLQWLGDALGMTSAQRTQTIAGTVDRSLWKKRWIGLRAQMIARTALLGQPLQAQRELANLRQAMQAQAAVQGGTGLAVSDMRLLAAVEASVGRGLLANGEVDRGMAMLAQSLKNDPTGLDAAQALAQAQLQRRQYSQAAQVTQQALASSDATPMSKMVNYPKAHLQALAADASRLLGQPALAVAKEYKTALQSWAALDGNKRLPPQLAAERALSAGRCLWFLGEITQAIAMVRSASDIDHDNATVAAQSLAFLLLANRPIEAMEVFQRAIRNPTIGDYYRTYMSLWVKLDAQQRGVAPPVSAIEFLSRMSIPPPNAGLRSRRWHEQLACAAIGQCRFDQLVKTAISTARAVEATFYQAVFTNPTIDVAALQRVSGASIANFAETDFARALLGQNPLASDAPVANAPHH
jgi:Tfp pilus assembly protein PilF